MPLTAACPSLARRCLTRSCAACPRYVLRRARSAYGSIHLARGPDLERASLQTCHTADGVVSSGVSKRKCRHYASGATHAPLEHSDHPRDDGSPAEPHSAAVLLRPNAWPVEKGLSSLGRGLGTNLGSKGSAHTIQDGKASMSSEAIKAAEEIDKRFSVDSKSSPSAVADTNDLHGFGKRNFRHVLCRAGKGESRRAEHGATEPNLGSYARSVETPITDNQSSNQLSTTTASPLAAYLMFALEKTGNDHAIPPKDPRRADPTLAGASRMSLQAILARHMLAVAEIREKPAFHSAAFDPQRPPLASAVEKYLLTKGYSLTDLGDWTSLLTATDLHAPTTRLFGSQRGEKTAPPLFLLLFILRRKTIHARTLQILVTYTWRMLQHHRAVSEAIDRNTVMVLFVRLLRHARQVWPEAIVNIAKLVSTYVWPDTEYEEKEYDVQRFSRVSALYNRVLQQLAKPVSSGPFKYSIYQEIAQFDLLHAMASHRPPLRIGREGYEALTRVLLSRTKTERERDWTSLQAASWPPWKRARSGIDEAKDLEYGMSRAAVSLQRMVQAGHGHGLWGTIAKIYAGRDIDGSPVVQTRTLLDKVTYEEADAKVWEARINTTRTIREAWACFVSYKDSRVTPSELVYSAIIVKLLLNHKTLSRNGASNDDPKESGIGMANIHDHADSSVMAGDALEPLLEPTYPGDRTYVPTEPPSPMDLFTEMIDLGLAPRQRTIGQILRHARNVEDGLTYLDKAGPPYCDWLRVLASGNKIQPQALQKIPESIYNSFVALLCRSPRSSLRLMHGGPSEESCGSEGAPKSFPRKQNPAFHAMRLLFLRQSTDRQLWAALLRALCDGQAHLTVRGRDQTTEDQAILRLQMMRRALALMKRFRVEPNTSCLMAISVGVEHAALASRSGAEPEDADGSPSDWSATIDEILDLQIQEIALRPWRGEPETEAAQVEAKASRFLRALFRSVVLGGEEGEAAASTSLPDSAIPPVPRLLAVPSPAELHAYVRALGVLGDHEGIWSLVQWMAEHHETIWTQVLEQRGGKRRWNTLLAAIRVFLEIPQYDAGVIEAGIARKMKPAGEELTALVRQKISSVADWKWPGKTAIWQYTSRRVAQAEAVRPSAPSIRDYL